MILVRFDWRSVMLAAFDIDIFVLLVSMRRCVIWDGLVVEMYDFGSFQFGDL